MRRETAVRLAVGLFGVLAATLLLRMVGVTNPTTVALTFLLVTLFVASLGDMAIAITTSVAATLTFNFFFLPPIGTLTIADPHNLVALLAFLIVSIVASRLSATARSRTHEALERRNELTRLFDLTRDILLTTEQRGALAAIARHVARRFELETVVICVPGPAGWDLHQGGPVAAEVPPGDLDRVFAANAGAIEFDARSRAYGGHRDVATAAGVITVAPVRVGGRVVALLATGGRELEPGTRDAVAGIVAIAIERTRFMEERHSAELARQRADLASALLASLSHDLRTPITAIGTAVSNLDAGVLSEDQRREQARVAADELKRLTRLFDEILDMARIDAGTVQPRRGWTTPAEIVEAALAHDAAMRAGHDSALMQKRIARWTSIRGWPLPRSRTWSRTPSAMPGRERLSSAGGPTSRGCASRCAMKAKDSSRRSSSGCSSPSIAARCSATRSRGPAWGSRSRAASSPPTAAACGQRIWLRAGRRSRSRFPAGRARFRRSESCQCGS